LRYGQDKVVIAMNQMGAFPIRWLLERPGRYQNQNSSCAAISWVLDGRLGKKVLAYIYMIPLCQHTSGSALACLRKRRDLCPLMFW
jgi:hypothetical protein